MPKSKQRSPKKARKFREIVLQACPTTQVPAFWPKLRGKAVYVTVDPDGGWAILPKALYATLHFPETALEKVRTAWETDNKKRGRRWKYRILPIR